MPSALSKLRGSIQFASLVVEEGGEAHTLNVCQQCHIEGKPRLNSWQCCSVVEKKAHRGITWKIIAHEEFTHGMWAHFTLKRAEAKEILEDAARERQEGIQGQWQQASPFREVLEQARGTVETGCSAQIMRGSFIAKRDDSWEEFRKGMQRKREIIRMDSREDTRSL